MQAHFLTILIAVPIVNLLPFTEFDGSTNICSTDEIQKSACQCCKIACWHNIANAATNKLGHIPGQANEQEAMETLQLIRLCMHLRCGNICPRIPRSLFRLL